MTNQEIKKILEEQLVLLSKYSQKVGADVVGATGAMIGISTLLTDHKSFSISEL